MNALKVALLGFAGVVLPTSELPAVKAQQVGPMNACRPTEVAQRMLHEMGEQLVWRGVAGTGDALLELWMALDGRWTLVVTNRGGVSCYHVAGLEGAMVQDE